MPPNAPSSSSSSSTTTTTKTNGSSSRSRPTIPSRIRDKLIESISLNRVTIVVGPTGCGKSTQIPPLLLDGLQQQHHHHHHGSGGGGSQQQLLPCRILCSQPRRLAVVAIAKRVAEERGVELGGTDVGYHVGNHNMSVKQTKLVFTTAGILLEELRNNGIDAITQYKCIIIDECHERSPESDLVLALVKKFLQTHPREPNVRIVLMSATFNHKRYADYFKNVPGCFTIDTITLETAESFMAFHNRVRTYYMDSLPLPLSDEDDDPHPYDSVLKTFIRSMRLNPNNDLNYEGGKTLSPSMLLLIQALVIHLDTTEPPDGTFLLFAPTYRHLEQVHNKLTPYVNHKNGQSLQLSVLHSAVDIEDCIRTMLASSTSRGRGGPNGCGRRHVLLASAIADSSVTVPGVTCVIDLCRSLEVKWDMSTRSYIPRTVWCSKSIADQRKGRTGRTCPGKVFRLVHQGFYIQQLEQWDVAQLEISSCHNEVLAMVTTSDKLKSNGEQMFHPKQFFRELCLDPPPEDVVDDAIDYLVDIGACHRVRNDADLFFGGGSSTAESSMVIAPTDYGNLMAALPLSVAESRLVLEGGRIGLLHEVLALTALYNHKPSPIVHYFGETNRNQNVLDSFHYDSQGPIKRNKKNASSSSSPVSAALSNLSAYLYWDVHWHQPHNERNLSVYDDISRQREEDQHPSHYGTHDQDDNDPWRWSPNVDLEHIDWCKDNEVNPTSMRAITEIIECTMNVLYHAKYEPEWLRCTNPTPLWKRPEDWDNERRGGDLSHTRQMLNAVYGNDGASKLCDALRKLMVDKTADGALPLARGFHGIDPEDDENLYYSNTNNEDDAPVACVHFLMGKCKYGQRCRQSHSRHARRPPCRFFLAGTCTKGDRCIYLHEDSPTRTNSHVRVAPTEKNPTGALVPVIESLRLPMGPKRWFQGMANEMVLLGEGNFQFTKALMEMGSSPRFSSIHASKPRASGANPPPQAIFGVDATLLHRNENVNAIVQSCDVSCFAWNFPFTGKDEDSYEHESLILQTLQSLIVLFTNGGGGSKSTVTFGLTLQGDQWSRWNVTRSMWRTGWQLKGWSNFDHTDFPGYHPRRENGDKFPVDSARLYVLERVMAVE